MKCVVFSNFGGDYFEKSVRPKLEALGVEVVRVILPGKETDFSAEYDLLVGFQDMTVKSQREAMKSAAKKYGKPSVFLSKSSPNWERELAERMPEIPAPPPAAGDPAPAREIPRIAGVPKDRVGALVTEYVRAVEAGEDPGPAFAEALGRSPADGEAETVIAAIRASSDCPVFFLEWLLSREPAPEPDPLPLDPEMVALYAEENASLRAEVESLRKRIAELEGAEVRPPDGVPARDMKAVAELNNLKQEISAVRELHECGAIPDREALRLLLAIPAAS